jgi:hypothetical protein
MANNPLADPPRNVWLILSSHLSTYVWEGSTIAHALSRHLGFHYTNAD